MLSKKYFQKKKRSLNHYLNFFSLSFVNIAKILTQNGSKWILNDFRVKMPTTISRKNFNMSLNQIALHTN